MEHLLLTNVDLSLTGADLTNFQLYDDKANSIVGTQLDEIFDGGRDIIDHAPNAHDDRANAVAGVVALMTKRRVEPNIRPL